MTDTRRRNRPLILHLSADFPDPHRDRTTTAIERLIQGVPEADHIVVSLHRSSHPLKTHFTDCGQVNGVRLVAFRYFALPFAVMLAPFMQGVARRVMEFLQREELQPDVIHAHKFAFEGISALWLLDRLGSDTRLLVSVRGEADKKVLYFKPNYRRLLRRIAERASVIYYVSAWFKPAFHQALSIDPAKERLLPNIVGNASPKVTSEPAEEKFVCVLNLDIRRRKGLKDLLEAFSRFREKHPGVGLDLIGSGTPESVKDVEAQVNRLDLQEAVQLLGPMSGAELFKKLPRYLALLLPSYNETFGMVYVEALFAGIPILYGRDTGIDGYLEGIKAGVAATPGNIDQIESGIVRLYEENTSFREEIASAEGLLFDRFAPSAILERYRKDLSFLTTARQAPDEPT